MINIGFRIDFEWNCIDVQWQTDVETLFFSTMTWVFKNLFTEKQDNGIM